MVSESVHALAACAHYDVFLWPFLKSEFPFEIDLEMLVPLSMGCIHSAYFQKGLGGVLLKYLVELLFCKVVFSTLLEVLHYSDLGDDL